MKGPGRQNAGKMPPIGCIAVDVRSSFHISRQTGDARDDAVVEMPSYQRRFRFIAPDGTVCDTAKRNSGAFDDAIVVRIEQDSRAGHGKIPVPPRILLE